jgi:predicted N-acetyltransferase YhbS
MTMDFTVSDLRDKPAFFDILIQRIWHAWWKHEGHALDPFSAKMRRLLDDEALPFALVAHRGDLYLGSALGLAADLDERPQYTPWIAAVWVDPDHRSKKLGRTLIDRTKEALVDLGYPRVYLNSIPELREFYTRQGWRPIEEKIGPKALIVYASDAQIASEP